MKIHKIVVASVLAVLYCASGVLGAGYLKFEGVEGEAKSAEDRPTEEVSFYYNKIAFSKIIAKVGGPLLIKDDEGKTTALKKDGLYTTSNGERIVVKNGRVAETTLRPQFGSKDDRDVNVAPGTEELPAVQKVRDAAAKSESTDTPAAGQQIDSGTTEKPAGLLLPAVQKVRDAASRSESTDPPAAGQQIDSGTTEEPAGLLLPAVQKVRESAPRSRGQGGDGGDGASGGVIAPMEAAPVTDKMDSPEIRGPSATSDKKKGNVETEWKVEEGEK